VLVAEIDDRIRFSKHFVILGNVESLGLLWNTTEVLPLKGFVVAHLPVLAFRSW